MSPVNAAAKEAHDEELEKMESEIAAKVADPNYDPEKEIEETSVPEKTDTDKSAEVETKQPSTEDEATTTPPAKPDGAKPEEEREELSDEDVQKLSGKAQKRFKSLADENMRVKRENDFLRKHLNKPEEKEVETPSKIRLPWETEEEEAEDPVIVAKRAALEAVAEEKRQSEIISNLQNDSTELENAYPELNPKDKSYDPTLVTKISVWYKTLFKDNNNLRLKDFATELMSLRAAGVDRGKSEVTEKVVKQAAQQAIISNAPASSPASSVEQKIKGAKTMEELEALEAQL
jgi:hypothetical protein